MSRLPGPVFVGKGGDSTEACEEFSKMRRTEQTRKQSRTEGGLSEVAIAGESHNHSLGVQDILDEEARKDRELAGCTRL